jgi:4-amino-4-deoxy-L-arabinose transferase-like glycosyltransferase
MYAFYLLGLFSLLGTTFLALKVASLLPALLTLLAFYPFARLLFGAPTALAATFLFAVNRWHVTMSRWGWNEITPPLFQLLTLHFLIRGTRSRLGRDFALGGLFLGLGMYTYLASRMVVLVVLAYILYRIMVERGFLRHAWTGLVIFWLTYGLTFAPLANTYLHNPFTFLNRMRQVSILNDIERAGGSYWPLLENIQRHVLMFHVQGDRNPRHNLPGAPMLDPVTGTLFLFGIGFALWRWKDHRRALLLLWLPITLIGGILSSLNEGPQAYRTLGVVPAVCLLAGDALVRGVSVLRIVSVGRTWRPFLLRWAGGLTIVSLFVLVYAGWRNYEVFFRLQAKDAAVYSAFSPVETAVAKEVVSHLGHKTFLLSPRLYYFSVLRFLTYRPPEGRGELQKPPYHLFQGAEDLPFTQEPQGDIVLLLDAHYIDLVELFQRFYPTTVAEMIRGRLGEPLYLKVTIPQQEVAAIRGLEGQYELPDGRIIHQREAQIDLDWTVRESSLGAIPVAASWYGGIAIPRSGVYTFYSEGSLEVKVGGRVVNGPTFLGKGLQAFRVTQVAPAQRKQARLFWQSPDGREGLVPPELFFTIRGWEHGLRGTYYRGESLESPPVFDRVDPLILFAWPEPEPWNDTFSARWVGEIEAPETGTYTFHLGADDGVRFYLDGHPLGEQWLPNRANDLTVETKLTEGRHKVQIEYFQRGGAKSLEFWWAPPGEKMKPVAPSFLYPGPAEATTFAPVEPTSTQVPTPSVPGSSSLQARQIFTGTTESDPWEIPLGRIGVSGRRLIIRILPVPGYDAVYDYLRVVGSDGQSQVFEAEDTHYTTGDEYSDRHIVDGHWWLQTFGSLSNRQGLVALGEENAPPLTTIVPLSDGEYDVYLGTFTGDPANGPFAIAVDY